MTEWTSLLLLSVIGNVFQQFKIQVFISKNCDNNWIESDFYILFLIFSHFLSLLFSFMSFCLSPSLSLYLSLSSYLSLPLLRSSFDSMHIAAYRTLISYSNSVIVSNFEFITQLKQLKCVGNVIKLFILLTYFLFQKSFNEREFIWIEKLLYFNSFMERI